MSNIYYANLGLQVDARNTILSIAWVVEEISNRLPEGVELITYRRFDSTSEPTLVAVFEVEDNSTYGFISFIDTLARLFEQDCIAVYLGKTDTGRLVGPKAELWGPFNPEFFISYDGRTLAQLKAAAAQGEQA